MTGALPVAAREIPAVPGSPRALTLEDVADIIPPATIP
jgi:hypothetical protein